MVAAEAGKEAEKDTATGATVASAANGAKTRAVLTAAGAAAPLQRARLSLNPTGAGGVVLEAAAPGAWANGLEVTVDYNTLKKDDGSNDPNLFNLSVKDGSGRSELFRNISRDKTYARYVPRVLANELSLVRVISGSEPDKRPDAGTSTVDPDGVASDSKELQSNGFKGEESKKTGIYALEKADLFNLLCIPPDTRADGAAPDTPTDVYQAALPYCVKRRAMLLVDPPRAWSANPSTAAATAKNGLSALGLSGQEARNAAIYFPRLREADPQQEGRIAEFVPCGAVAGILARTDGTRGVWKAPAGIDATLNGVAQLTVKLTDGENGQLNQLGVNCLRSFPVYGQVVWGSRTLRGADQAADEYKYLPVRRTALFIEESLYRGTQWVVFEPNDEPLWAQVRLNIGAFMQNLFRQGAFQGKTPQEAYFVKCDKETTIQNDINLGIVNIIVGFAPLKPAEFVVIYLQQMAGQIQT